jgi:hypothetical protein
MTFIAGEFRVILSVDSDKVPQRESIASHHILLDTRSDTTVKAPASPARGAPASCRLETHMLLKTGWLSGRVLRLATAR